VQLKDDECFNLIKAIPHRSSNYFETVCCAGVGRDRKWRRQYPVPFRILGPGQKFSRWDWLSYKYVDPKNDKRFESQKVVSDTLKIGLKVKPPERASFLSPLVRGSLQEANDKGESLTLVRPLTLRITHKEKTPKLLISETRKHAAMASQLSLLENDHEALPLKPCPYEFKVHWTDQYGTKHTHTSDDWETSAAFFNFRRRYINEEEAIERLKGKYADYLKRGLVLGFSTHSLRNVTNNTSNQWLLVGMIRLDEEEQGSLLLN